MPVQSGYDSNRRSEALGVLRKVYELLGDRSKWVVGRLAVDADGASVWPNDPDALRFCAAGAISKFAHEASSREETAGRVEMTAIDLLSEALAASYFRRREIPAVNDGTNGYERIMAGLAKVVGVSPQRRAAALKGWATRRHKAWLREQEAASVDPRPEFMTFGGTITPSITTDAKKEYSHLPR
jgi:hypothetical protein